MDVPWWCWIGVCAFVWIAQCGIWWTVVPLCILASFLVGAVSFLYFQTQQPLLLFRNNIFSDYTIKPGLRKVVEELNAPKKLKKLDKRLTGSHIIDESLQEIIGYLLTDSIKPWYEKLSDDDEFISSIRESLQKIVINIAARMKDVSWISYMTTRLVDDAATHLRLYRQAYEKTKTNQDAKKPTPQSLASFKSATSQGHSRNNSDGSGKAVTCHSRNSSLTEKPLDLETIFFQLENEAEKLRPSYDQLCKNRENEKRYMDDILDVILYLVLPADDFKCLPVRELVREILIGGVLLPLFDMLTDPDYINRCFIHLCQNVGLTSEALMSVVRSSAIKEELIAVLEVVNREISIVRGRDSGGEGDSLVRQQLNSLLYLKKVIDTRIQGGFQKDRNINEKATLVILPLTVLLKNNLALSYFIDYLSTMDMQNYIFLHLSIESWRVASTNDKQRGEHPLRKFTKSGNDNIREGALNIYQQFLSEQVSSRVHLDRPVEDQLYARITKEPISDHWFDDLLYVLQKKLQDKLLPDFYKSNVYVKLLSDMELLKEGEQDDDSQSPDSISLAEGLDEENEPKKEPEYGIGSFTLKVEIIDSGVVQDRGKTYGIYALTVSRLYQNGFIKKWHVYRRYSDFYDLQQKIGLVYADLRKLPFPGKKTFHNMEAATLSKRMKMLNDYIQILLHSGVVQTHPRLPELMLTFLEPGEYDKATSLSSAIESVVSPIKSSMRTVSAAVRTVPDNLLSSVDGLSRTLQGRKDPSRLAAELVTRNDEDVPLRIMLLLMDEVFDLQSRNQWLRRRIVALLRQMFGDIYNRKILDYVQELTAENRVAGYLQAIKDILWPGGVRAEAPGKRDSATKLRTCIVAKSALLSSLSDDFKHLLGSDTTRRGLLRVYNTFQHPILNRRLLHVLLEGILELIFPPVTSIHSKLIPKR